VDARSPLLVVVVVAVVGRFSAASLTSKERKMRRPPRTRSCGSSEN